MLYLSRMRRWQAPVALAMTLAWAGVAFAHPLAPSLLDVREVAGGRVEVAWKTSKVRVPGANPRPVLPARCHPLTAPEIGVDAISVRTRWTAACGPGGLVGAAVRVDGLPDSATVVVRVTLRDGRTVTSLLSARRPSFVVPGQPHPWSVVRGYVELGVGHILSGMDHLLFVFGLLLLARTRRLLLATITAFTVGHSVTLSLVVLDFVRPPQGPTELAIALSVLVLAVELARDPDQETLLRRYPWLMSFSFGLLHGLGFAAAMQSTGLPYADLPVALASFNVGIEAGQLAFVATILAARYALTWRAPALAAWVGRVPVYTMGSLAAFWTFERAADLLR